MVSITRTDIWVLCVNCGIRGRQVSYAGRNSQSAASAMILSCSSTDKPSGSTKRTASDSRYDISWVLMKQDVTLSEAALGTQSTLLKIMPVEKPAWWDG